MPSSKPTMISTSMASHKTVTPVALTQAQVPLLAVSQTLEEAQASPRVPAALKATLIATLPLMLTAKLTSVAPPPMTSAMTSISKAA